MGSGSCRQKCIFLFTKVQNTKYQGSSNSSLRLTIYSYYVIIMHRIHFQRLAPSQQNHRFRSRLPIGRSFLALTDVWRRAAPISAKFLSSNDSEARSIPPLSFPGPTTNDASSATTGERTTLTFGETIQVDMGSGPIVLNANGTTSRITNWDEMSEIEQQATRKMIPKRNEQRRTKLLLLHEEKEQKIAQKEEEENKNTS